MEVPRRILNPCPAPELRSPDALIFPATSSFSAGAAVPIPTLPAESIVMRVARVVLPKGVVPKSSCVPFAELVKFSAAKICTAPELVDHPPAPVAPAP